MKKLPYILLALAIILIGAAGVYAYVLKTSSSTVEASMASGSDAEKVGNTQKALDEYRKASENCANTDQRCKIDTETKIELMEKALAEEKSIKVGEPVEGAEKIPTENNVTPDDSKSNG